MVAPATKAALKFPCIGCGVFMILFSFYPLLEFLKFDPFYIPIHCSNSFIATPISGTGYMYDPTVQWSPATEESRATPGFIPTFLGFEASTVEELSTKMQGFRGKVALGMMPDGVTPSIAMPHPLYALNATGMAAVHAGFEALGAPPQFGMDGTGAVTAPGTFIGGAISDEVYESLLPLPLNLRCENKNEYLDAKIKSTSSGIIYIIDAASGTRITVGETSVPADVELKRSSTTDMVMGMKMQFTEDLFSGLMLGLGALAEAGQRAMVPMFFTIDPNHSESTVSFLMDQTEEKTASNYCGIFLGGGAHVPTFITGYRQDVLTVTSRTFCRPTREEMEALFNPATMPAWLNDELDNPQSHAPTTDMDMSIPGLDNFDPPQKDLDDGESMLAMVGIGMFLFYLICGSLCLFVGIKWFQEGQSMNRTSHGRPQELQTEATSVDVLKV